MPEKDIKTPVAASVAFLQQLQKPKVPVSQLSEEDKAWKKLKQDYDNGRLKFNSLPGWDRSNDTSSVITITAPNTDTSKFVFNNKVTQNTLNAIKDSAKNRQQDPYDILAHMLIEASGDTLKTNTNYNVHDVIAKQISPVLLRGYSDPTSQLKQMGVGQENKTFTAEDILKAGEKMNQRRNKALSEVEVPTSNVDAVALRMLLHGRDFNPAQKGHTTITINDDGSRTEKTVKYSYLDMINSAINSLKTHMPNLFNPQQ